MVNKVILYTVNLNMVPKTFNDVIDVARKNNCYRISSTNNNIALKNVEPGDNIVTKKGNSLYVLAIGNSTDEVLPYADGDVKESKILSVANVIKRGTWDKSYIDVRSANKKETSALSMTDKIKSMFMPTRAKDVAISMNGDLCVATKEGYVSINANNELVSYPSELVIPDMPAYVISKPVDQVTVGDIIQVKESYVKVAKRDGAKLTCISYTGSGKVVHTIKDVILNQNLVRVVITLTGSVNNQINPMMMMLLAKDGKGSDSLLPLLMMNQQNGALGTNPMLMALAMGDGEMDSKTLLMMSMMGGSTPFGNLFNAAPAKKEAKADVVEPVEEVNDLYAAEPAKDVEDTDVAEQD